MRAACLSDKKTSPDSSLDFTDKIKSNVKSRASTSKNDVNEKQQFANADEDDDDDDDDDEKEIQKSSKKTSETHDHDKKPRQQINTSDETTKENIHEKTWMTVAFEKLKTDARLKKCILLLLLLLLLLSFDICLRFNLKLKTFFFFI